MHNLTKTDGECESRVCVCVCKRKEDSKPSKLEELNYLSKIVKATKISKY